MIRNKTRKIMACICFATFTTFSSASIAKAITVDNTIKINKDQMSTKEKKSSTKDMTIDNDRLTRQVMGKKEKPSDKFVNAKTEEQAMKNLLSQPKKGVSSKIGNKAVSETKYTLAQLASMDYTDMTNLLAQISFYDITDLFQNTDGAKQFYNNTARMDHLFSNLAWRGSSFTANDDKGIPTIEEVIRSGFYLGYYNQSDYPNMYTTTTKNKTLPIYEAMLNNPNFRYGTDTQNYVMESFGSLIGNSTCTTDIANRCVPLLREFRENYRTYLQSVSKGKAVYGIMAGIGYVYYTEAYEHYYDAPETLPSYGKLDSFIDELMLASQITGLSTDNKWYTDNAVYYLGQLSKFYSNQNEILRMLTDKMNSAQKYSADFFSAASQIHQSFNNTDADGRKINYEQLQKEGNEYWMPKHYTFDNGAIQIQAGDKVSPEKINRMYWATKEVESQFFRIYGNDKPLEPNNPDKVLTIRLFNSPAEYTMNSYLNGIDTNNGGMYIEPYGTFYTYERTTEDSVYSLEELFRHEFTHHLQGKYQIPGMWGEGDFYKNHEAEWIDEGTAEFFAGSTRNEGVQPRQAIIGYFANDRASRFTLDTLFRSGYASGWDFYNYGCAYITYLYRNDINTLKKLNQSLMNNKIADYRSILNEQRYNSTVEDAYQNLMDQLIRDKESGKIGTPLVGDAYVQTHEKRTLAQIKGDIQGVTGITNFTESKTKSPNFSMFKLEGVYTGAASAGEISDWKAMNAKANEMLKNLSTKGWTGYDTVTCYFTNYKVVNGAYQFNIVFRGLLNDDTVTPVDPTQNQVPVAVIDALSMVKVNETVAFNSDKSTDSDGKVVSYQWNFGDNMSSTVKNPSHIYSKAGEYKVVLIVKDDKGATGSTNFKITVTDGENKLPVATIEGNLIGKVNDILQFKGQNSKDEDGKIVSYEWNFGDGTTGTGMNVSHAYTAGGTYIVNLKVKDDKGAVAQNFMTVTITKDETSTGKPMVSIIGENYEVANISIVFSGKNCTSSNGKIVKYEWSFGDGTIGTGKNIAHTFKNAGTYVLTLKVTDNKGAVGQSTINVNIAASDTGVTIPNNLSIDEVYVKSYNATIAAQQFKTQDSINNARIYIRKLMQMTKNNKPLHDTLVGTLSSMLDPMQHNIFVNFYSIIYKTDKVTPKEKLTQEEINEARHYIMGFLGAEENAAYVPTWSSAVDVFQGKNIEIAVMYLNKAKASKSPVDIATAKIYIEELVKVKNNEDVLNFAFTLQDELEVLQ